MTGQLYINGKDAYDNWGIFLEDGALSSLMTPAPCKEFISNKYRSKSGKHMIKHNPRLDERDITLSFCMTAKSETVFLANYANFCDDVLSTGELTIRTSFQPNTYYRCIYLSCSQYSQYLRQLAKFSLKLNEPDPSDRGEVSKYEEKTE